jgi:hypothetical protein
MPRKVPTAVAARILGKSENFIRFGLQQGRLPFGSAVKTAKDRWSYHISPLLLANYSGVALGQIITLIEEYGEDIGPLAGTASAMTHITFVSTSTERSTSCATTA